MLDTVQELERVPERPASDVDGSQAHRLASASTRLLLVRSRGPVAVTERTCAGWDAPSDGSRRRPLAGRGHAPPLPSSPGARVDNTRGMNQTSLGQGVAHGRVTVSTDDTSHAQVMAAAASPQVRIALHEALPPLRLAQEGSTAIELVHALVAQGRDKVPAAPPQHAERERARDLRSWPCGGGALTPSA